MCICSRDTLGIYKPRRGGGHAFSLCILLTEVAIIMPQRDVIITGHKNKQQTLLCCQQPLRKKAHTQPREEAYMDHLLRAYNYTQNLG